MSGLDQAGTARALLHQGRWPRASGYDVTRCALGLLLLGAALLKGVQLTTGPAIGGDLFSSRRFLIGLVEFEVAFGLWLLTGLAPRATRILALGCFGAFAAFSLWKGLSGASSCGCLGRLRLNPWLIFAVDVAAVAALAWFRPQGAGPTPRSDPARLFFWATFAFWGGAIGAWAMTSGQEWDSQAVVVRPGKWVGACFPLLEFIDVGEELAEGEWVLVFHRHDCPRCKIEIPKYDQKSREAARQGVGPRYALIEVPPYGYGDGDARPVASDSPCVVGRLDASRIWVLSTPMEMSLRDCVVMPPAG